MMEAQSRLLTALFGAWGTALTGASSPCRRGGQALRTFRLERESGLRIPEGRLSFRRRLGDRHGRARRRHRRRNARASAVLHPADRKRRIAFELSADQSGSAQGDRLEQCGEPRARHADARGGSGGRQRIAAHPAIGCDEVQGRREPRAHAGEGHLPERHLPDHSVRVWRSKRPEAAASHRAALDQQVLCARPDAGEIPHPLARRTGPYRLRHLLDQSRGAPRREEFRTLHEGRHSHRPRRDRDGNRGEEGQRRRLLRRRNAPRGDARLHGGEEGPAHRERDAAYDTGRLFRRRRPEGLCGSRDDRSDRRRR